MANNYPLSLDWLTFWTVLLPSLPADVQRSMAISVDRDISSFIKTAPLSVQTEVLATAPRCVVDSLTKRGLLSRNTLRSISAANYKPSSRRTNMRGKSSSPARAAYAGGGD